MTKHGKRTRKAESGKCKEYKTLRASRFMLRVIFVFSFLLPYSCFADENAYDHLINKFAMEYGLDPATIKAVIKAESNFNKFTISRKGAVGLMQLMPDTARKLAVTDIHSPEENIRGGTKYLRDMLYIFKGDLIKALAAYNAGPGCVKRHNGVPPYRETRQYIDNVIKYKRKYDSKNKIYYYTDENGCVVFFNR